MKLYGLSLQLDDIHEVARLARLAEEAGFDSVWAADTPRSNVFVHMAAMALNTKKIKIGSGIARAFVRGPLQTAAAASDLDRLSGGRVVLGLGTGTPKQNLYETGQRIEHPASQVKELIQLLRQIWTMNKEDTLVFKGQFYDINVRGFTLTNPPRPNLPVYLAAVNNFMIRSAGEVADGLAGHPIFSVRYMQEVVLPQFQMGCQRAGRTHKDYKITCWLVTSISDDRVQARRDAAYQIGFYFSTRSYGHIADFHGWGKEVEAIQKAFFEKKDMAAVADAVSDEMIDTLAIAGTPDDCREQLQRFQAVLDFPIFIPPGVGPARILPQGRVIENFEKIIQTFAQ